MKWPKLRKRAPCVEHVNQSSRTTPLRMSTQAISLRVANAQKSPLIALPGELRNKIYRYVLLDTEIDITTDHKAIHTNTGLLRASAQIREEASPIFYGENTFVITHKGDQQTCNNAEYFLGRVGSKNARRMTSVVFCLHCPDIVTELFLSLNRNSVSGSTHAQALEATVQEFGALAGSTLQDLLFRTLLGPARSSVFDTLAVVLESGVPTRSVTSQIFDIGIGEGARPVEKAFNKFQEVTLGHLSQLFEMQLKDAIAVGFYE